MGSIFHDNYFPVTFECHFAHYAKTDLLKEVILIDSSGGNFKGNYVYISARGYTQPVATELGYEFRQDDIIVV